MEDDKRQRLKKRIQQLKQRRTARMESLPKFIYDPGLGVSKSAQKRIQRQALNLGPQVVLRNLMKRTSEETGLPLEIISHFIDRLAQDPTYSQEQFGEDLERAQAEMKVKNAPTEKSTGAITPLVDS
tara:strand:+ start:7613 stop:7993 length:381 start_codon:yes stop_codon:yes gene_type:complete